MIHQESLHMNPALGELHPIPIYPHHSLPYYMPYDGLAHGGTDRGRNVVLTSSRGESLVWISNVHFVIDIGLERRKVHCLFHSILLLLPKDFSVLKYISSQNSFCFWIEWRKDRKTVRCLLLSGEVFTTLLKPWQWFQQTVWGKWEKSTHINKKLTGNFYFFSCVADCEFSFTSCLIKLLIWLNEPLITVKA